MIEEGRATERKEISDEWKIPAKEIIEEGRWKEGGKEIQILEDWELQVDGSRKGEKEINEEILKNERKKSNE